MANELLFTFIGIGGAISGIIISQFFGYLNRNSEEKRWYNQFFLKLKIDALTKLHQTLEDCSYIFDKFGNYGVEDLEQFHQEVMPIEESYRRAIRDSFIYLTEKQYVTFGKLLGEYRKIADAIYNHVQTQVPEGEERKGPIVDNWTTQHTAYTNAKTCIKEMLNPSSLREYIKTL